MKLGGKQISGGLVSVSAAALIIFLLLGTTPTSADNTSAAVSSSTAVTLTREELQQQVQTKAQQLDVLNQQLEATRRSLQSTKQERLTLQQTLSNLQSNINELNLSVAADKISIQKLNLEIESLNYDIQDIETSINDKKGAIYELIKELQINDSENSNLLMVFLKNKSLADALLEVQNFKNIQTQLSIDIANLNFLHDEYNQKISDSNNKKDSIAVHQTNLGNKLAIVQDQKSERQKILTVTKNKEGVFQQQLTELEKQQQQIASDIETLDAVLRTKIDPSILPPFGHGVLAIPVQGDTLNNITQGYGATRFAKNGYRGRWHNGVDLAAPLGIPVLSAEDGVVAGTGNQDAYCPRGAYGKFIAINHNDNLTTLYGHLSRPIVKKGDVIKRGQVIGYSGMTGYATGPHLHFTVFAQPTFYIGPSKGCGPMPYGGDLNPLSYL